MSHQHRHGHALEDRPGGAAEHQLAHARMRVGAHDQQVGAAIGDVRQESLSHAELARRHPLQLDLHVVAGEVRSDIGAWHLAVAERRVVWD